ncbi:MAG: response regulator transcription factor [Ktedonobacteraceae bacterium]|nr:response regulator transcription factor [Ktedonobacteraceae bacterium]
MELKILIAEPREVIRIGLRTLIKQNEQIVEIYEALTSEEIQNSLHKYDLDLIFAHQSFLTDLNILPMNKTILLIDEPEISLFIDAHMCNVRGYLSNQFSSDLLFAALHSAEDTCLLDPVFFPWIMEYLLKYRQEVSEVARFSHREREIVQLQQNGLDRKTIAQQLHISEATLKTHIKNITRKKESRGEKNNLLPTQTELKLLKRKAL